MSKEVTEKEIKLLDALTIQDFRNNGFKTTPNRDNIKLLCATVKAKGCYSEKITDFDTMTLIHHKLNTKEFLV